MNKKTIKTFVKEHKVEISIGCTVVTAVIGGVLFGKKVIIPKRKALKEAAECNLQRLYEWYSMLDYAAEGSNQYLPAKVEELVEIDENFHCRDKDGVLFKVNGAILFGNIVDET